MGIIETIKDWLFAPDTDPNDPIDDPEDDCTRDYQKGESIKGIDAFVVVIKPTGFNDVEQLCKHLKSGKAILLNTENMASGEKQRLLDFLSGVVMARDGTIARIYQNVYICASNNIGIIEE